MSGETHGVEVLEASVAKTVKDTMKGKHRGDWVRVNNNGQYQGRFYMKPSGTSMDKARGVKGYGK